MKLKKGDRIRVTATILSIGPGGYVALKLDGSEARIAFWPDAAGEIELLEPENWPPQAGDIWEADGMEYFTRTYNGQVSLYPEDYYGLTFTQEPGLAEFKSLGPKLVRRRG